MEYENYLIIAALLVSAFFSGTETAFLSANRLHIRVQKTKTIAGKILFRFVENQSLFISIILIGNILSLVVFNIYLSEWVNERYSSIDILGFRLNDITIILFQTFLSTLIIVIFAELIPKILSLIAPDRIMEFVAYPSYFIYIALYPFGWGCIRLSRFILNIFIRDFKTKTKFEKFATVDLHNYMHNTIKSIRHGNLDIEVNKELFNNISRLESIKVRECLIPRKEVVGLKVGTSMQDLCDIAIKSGFSKIIAYRESIDDVVGYYHVHDIFEQFNDMPTDAILKHIMAIPESMNIDKLMVQFIKTHNSIAWVVDEFGGTSGIITMEDIVEEIFGEIDDEYDKKSLYIKKIDANNYLLSARHEINFLNMEYNFDIPDGDYETLAGYIFSVYNDIPKINDTIETEDFTFTIRTMMGNRIDLVHFYAKKK